MANILLAVIYIAFIGLGIPDSLFVTAWPAIYQVTLLLSCCTVVSSLPSAQAIAKIGAGMITALSTTLTALVLFGFSISGNSGRLCLFAIPLGLGEGAIDSALNNYVALHYKATHMNFLHCFNGIAVSFRGCQTVPT